MFSKFLMNHGKLLPLCLLVYQLYPINIFCYDFYKENSQDNLHTSPSPDFYELVDI